MPRTFGFMISREGKNRRMERIIFAFVVAIFFFIFSLHVAWKELNKKPQQQQAREGNAFFFLSSLSLSPFFRLVWDLFRFGEEKSWTKKAKVRVLRASGSNKKPTHPPTHLLILLVHVLRFWMGFRHRGR